jgi:outer membrane receptor protein involved in Fe transport
MGTNVKRILWISAALMAAGAGAAYAQEAAPPAQDPAPSQTQDALEAEAEAEAEEEEGAIVVTGQAGDQVRIDRRTYTLQNDASAQTSPVIDALGRLPSVSVAPSGAIRLLGAENVTVQINGQPVPEQAVEQALRSLMGGDVERIEVITNPSATQSAAGTGGIINIITKQRFNGGLTGSIQGGVDSLGGYQLNIAPSYSQGPWTIGGRLGHNHGIGRNDLDREREFFATSDTITEQGEMEFNHNVWSGNFQVGYRPSQGRRLNFNVDSFDVNNDIEQELARADELGLVFNQVSNNDMGFSFNRASFDYQRDGSQPGEILKLNASLQGFQNNSENIITSTPANGDPASRYATLFDSEQTTASVKLDVERPIGENLLTYGAAVDLTEQETMNAVETLAGPPGPTDFEGRFEGEQSTYAAYATYQFATGDWTWLPGVRAENYRRQVTSAGGETDGTELDFFPSLHIRRELSEDLDLDLSYSRRIERPYFQQLDPSLRFFDATRAFGGNPNLRPTITDAFEANLTYQKDTTSVSLTLFDRMSEDIVSQFTELNADDVAVTTFVNAGESEQIGAQAIVRAPIFGNWRYSLSANLLEREFDVLQAGVMGRRSEFEYSGNASLEYRDPAQNQPGADHLQLDLQFQGPRHTLQGESDEFVIANFTWRRRLTDKLSSIVMIQDLFDSADQLQQLTTDDYFERIENRGVGTRLRLSLTYQLGSGPERPQDRMPSSAPPAMPDPMSPM